MKSVAQMLLILVILFLAEMIIFSSAFNKITVASRYIIEASIFSTTDKLDAYVKSFNDALQLSLLQSIYEAGANQQNSVWKNYDQIDADQYIQSMEIAIGAYTTFYAKQFLDSYKSYAESHQYDYIQIPDSSNLFTTSGVTFTSGDWNSKTPGQADLKFGQLTFNLTVSGIAQQTAHESFVPEAKVQTYFYNMFTGAKTDLESGQILNKIRAALLQPQTTTSTWCSGWDQAPPTCDAQFQSVYGMSYSDAINTMNSNIESNLNALANAWSENEPYTITFGNLQAESNVEIDSSIQQIGTCTRTVDSTTETTPEYQQVCTYTPQGAAKFVFSMKERQNRYAFWYNNKEVYDNITLNFTVVDGTAKLISVPSSGQRYLSVSANPPTVPADGSTSSTITISTSDFASGIYVILSTTRGTLSASSCTTDISGSCSVTITSTTAGSALIIAYANGYQHGTTTLSFSP